MTPRRPRRRSPPRTGRPGRRTCWPAPRRQRGRWRWRRRPAGRCRPGRRSAGANLAAPGVSQATAGDPVDTETGDFTQSSTDLTVPTFGPALTFSRTYDAQAARAQTVAGTPVAPGMPVRWGTDGPTTGTRRWSPQRPVPGDIYTLDGLRSVTGEGGPPTAAAAERARTRCIPTTRRARATCSSWTPAGNRIEEIPAASGTQWGISMTAGKIYTIAGSDTGAAGASRERDRGVGVAAR